ncbi:MAG: hypothetical protein IPK79_01555 [Vampirovibrionales bacterium]|nr:hypothetical protein [Vampirovibrionales bacterium]
MGVNAINGIDGLNLNRFDPLTRILLQRWNVAPLYAFDGSTLSTRGVSAALSGEDSFRLPATALSPSYRVFQPGGAQTPYDRGQVVTASPNGMGASLISADAVRAFSRPLSLGFSSAVGGFRVDFGSHVPSQAPALGASLSERTRYYSITDAQFDALLNGPDFIIPKAGPFGLRVLTDGLGGIDGVETVITTQSLLNNAYLSVEGPLSSAAAGVFLAPTSPVNPDAGDLPPSAAGSVNASLTEADAFAPAQVANNILSPAASAPTARPVAPVSPRTPEQAGDATSASPPDFPASFLPPFSPSSTGAGALSSPQGGSTFAVTGRFLEDIGALKQAATMTHPAYSEPVRPYGDFSAFLPTIPIWPGPARTRAEMGDIGATLDQAYQMNTQLALTVAGGKAREGAPPFESDSGSGAQSGMQQSPRRNRRFQANA